MSAIELPRKRRRGGRTYIGCSTCRTRKIKCDLRYPTCLNCDRSREYYCKGYPDTQDGTLPDGGGPTQLVYADFDTRPFDDLIGSDFELNLPAQPESDHNTVEELPITQLPGLIHTQKTASGQPYVADGDPAWTPSSIFQGPSATDGWDEAFDFFDTTKELSAHCDIHADSRGRPDVQPSHAPSGLTYIQQPAFLQVPSLPPSIVARDNAVAPRPGRGNDPRIVEKLIHHYRTHVSRLMMPTSSPSQNPYLCIYLPLALQGPSGDAKECLLMAILAVAAFNKAELETSDAKKYRDQAVDFTHRAGSILRSYTAGPGKQRVGPEDEFDRKALLAAVVTMTTVEIFSGGQQGKGYESLLLGKQIINITGGPEWWVVDPMRLTLLQIYRCLEIVAHTSGWKPTTSAPDTATNGWSLSTTGSRAHDSLPHRDDDDLVASAYSTSASRIPGPGGQYTLDVSFGVARKTLQCLNKTIELSSLREAAHHGHKPDRWRRWPEHTHRALRQLEAELFDVFDDPHALAGETNGASSSTPLLAQHGISDYVNEEIKENHVWAFHYSVALFFRRALCDGGASVGEGLVDDDPMVAGDGVVASSSTTARRHWSGQELVAKAFDHLENIEVLSGDAVVANTLWPAFIAAVEAVQTPLRHRALIWFVRAKRHGIGNIAKAKALVMEVWRRVDRQTWVRPETTGATTQNGELSRVDWREVMQEMKMYIMLT